MITEFKLEPTVVCIYGPHIIIFSYISVRNIEKIWWVLTYPKPIFFQKTNRNMYIRTTSIENRTQWNSALTQYAIFVKN